MPAKKKDANNSPIPNEDEKEFWKSLNPYGTVPKAIRFPEQVACQLDYLAMRMNTTTGKVLLAILEDVLPLFFDAPPTSTERIFIRQVRVYRAMKANDLLKTVNWDELLERIKFASNRREE